MAEYTVAGGPEFQLQRRPVKPAEVDAEEQRRRAELFLRLPSLFTPGQPLEDVMSTIAKTLVEHTSAVSAGVNLVRPEDVSTVALGYHNLPAGYLEGMELARQTSEQGDVFRQRARDDETWVLKQAPAYMLSRPEYAHMHDIIRQLPYDTLIGTPFLNRPDLMGFVYLYYAEEAEADEEEVGFAKELAIHARPLMENAWLFRESQRRASELEALSRADEAIHRSLLLEDVYQAVLDLAVDLLGADRSMFLAFDGEERLHCFASRGVPEEELLQRQEVYHAIPRRNFAHHPQELALTEDVQTSSKVNPALRKFSPVESAAELPVFVQDELFGIFSLGYLSPRRFSEDDQRLFRTLAARAGLAIQNAVLFREAQRRTTELEALSRGDQALHTSIDLPNVLEAMLDMAGDLFGAERSLFLTFDEQGRFHAAASRGVPKDELKKLQAVYETIQRSTFAKRGPEPTTVENVAHDPRTNPMVRQITTAVSTVDVPVFVHGEFFGIFVLSYYQRRTFTEDDRRLFRTLASRASLAIQNALLHGEAQRRSTELEALYTADEALHRSLKLEDVLQVMVELAVELLGASSSLVARWDEEDHLAVAATSGIPEERQGAINRRYQSFTREHYANYERPFRTALVEDVSKQSKIEEELRVNSPGSLAEVPVVVEGELWGFFNIAWTLPQTFSAETVRMIDAFASRASLAIQNALLFEQAQHSASMEERSRIARELHDSVSQALYGIGLGARTARRRLGDNAPPDVIEPVDYIVQLAESGLAETRALIFELVPDSLEKQGLVLALQRQAAATQARFRIQVEAFLCDEPELPIRAKEALYRIAQESLHNMAKHSQASHASLRLEHADSLVRLVVQDNGRGFDATAEFPGHLGLVSMQERTVRIGGSLLIESAPGKGTTVTATVPA